MELLKIEGVTKRIKKKTIIDNINMQINEGEIVGFLGPNGAGKTTTIKMVVGLFSITSGEIYICGHSIKTDYESAMANVGSIIENPDLYKRLTGRGNLEYFAAMHSPEAMENIGSVAQLVHMEGHLDEKLKTFSLGMRQRIGVAQALLHMPRLLVLDEPTNGLDPKGIKELRDLLKSLAKNSNVGVLVSSHLLSEMELLADRYYIIDKGVIVEEISVDDINSGGEHTKEFHLETDDNGAAAKKLTDLGFEAQVAEDGLSVICLVSRDDVPRAISGLVSGGVGIFSAVQGKESLEEKYINITKDSEI
ncbi:MAG: ABC transporter ATP-binding protein [Eubacteriaceae bacterium]|nr:ABC transporter ATP-binding protein [Eubacteriaceae bacterium]